MISAPAPDTTDSLSPPDTVIAVGDVHGCNDLLLRLLDKIERRMGDETYQLIFLGDYIDRGPDSRGVITTLLKLKDRRPDTIFLKGNHEQAMLDFLADPHEGEPWLSWGGEETLGSYGIPIQMPIDVTGLQMALADALPDKHFSFLMDLTLSHEIGDYVFVHAGLNPEKPMEAQTESDMLWIRDPFFNEGKGSFGRKIIVHGHTPVKNPMDLNWRVNVDTGAVWSSKLTAVVIREGRRQFITT